MLKDNKEFADLFQRTLPLKYGCMLGFPSYSFFWFPFLMAVMGLAGTFFCIFLWFIRVDNDEDKFKLVMGSLFCPIFLFLGIFFSSTSFYNTYKFRNIDISTVNGFEIIRSDGEYESDGNRKIIINDSIIIKEMLESLQKCRAYLRNHESFQEGYKIKLLFNDENLGNNFYFSIYRKSNGEVGRTILYPHFNQESNMNFGEFTCAEFQDLVTKHIDPLFPINK